MAAARMRRLVEGFDMAVSPASVFGSAMSCLMTPRRPELAERAVSRVTSLYKTEM